MEAAPFRRPVILKALFNEVTEVSAWKSIAVTLLVYAGVTGLAYAGSALSGWWLAPVAVFFIAVLQLHLFILMHEGSHYALHPNRKVNELFADIFCAIPLGTLVKNYRVFHLLHHRYTGSPEKDPEVLYYKTQQFVYARRSPWQFAKFMLADFAGARIWPHMKFMGDFTKKQQRAGKVESANARDILLNLGVWGGIGAASIVFGFWPHVLLFWLVPLAFVFFPLLHLHGFGEHTGATGPTEYERTWTAELNPLSHFVFYPLFSGYHLEHHFFPLVPWYHKKRLHAALHQDAAFVQKAAKNTLSSYVLGERSFLKAMLLGGGQYRVDDINADIAEQRGALLPDEISREVDVQLGEQARPPAAIAA